MATEGTATVSDTSRPVLRVSRSIDAVATRPHVAAETSALTKAAQNDGDVLAILSCNLEGNTWDAEIRIISTSTPLLSQYTQLLHDSASALTWMGTNQLCVGNDNGSLQVFGIPATPTVGTEISLIATIAAHSDIVSGVSSITSGEVASCSWDRSVATWDLSKPGAPMATHTWHSGRVFALDVSSAAPSLVASAGEAFWGSGMNPASSFVCDTRAPSAPAFALYTPYHATAVQWLPRSDTHLLVGQEDGSVAVYDLRSSARAPVGVVGASGAHRSADRLVTTPAAHVTQLASGAVRAIASTRIGDEFHVAVSGDNVEVQIARSPVEALHFTSNARAGHCDYVRAVAWGGSTLWSGSWDHTLQSTVVPA